MAITIDGAGTITGLSADGISSQPVFAGNVLQVVRATDSTDRSTTSASFVDASISVTITPKFSSSVLLLVWTAVKRGTRATTNAGIFTSITDNSNNPVSGAEEGRDAFFSESTGGTITELLRTSALIGYATPVTTSAVTFKGRFRTEVAGTATLQNSNMTGQLFAIEVAG